MANPVQGGQQPNEGDSNQSAFLRLIRWAEFYPTGGLTNVDYTKLFGGGTFKGTSDHPNQPVTKWGQTANVAGAYQFKPETWKQYKKKLGLTDFGPTSQDRAAVEIIREHHALDLVKSGKIEEAIARLRHTWTSLPGAKEANGGMTMKKALAKFTTFGGTLHENK